jgi:adenylate cyclase
LTAYDHFLRALDLINRRELQSFNQAERHLVCARELEPSFAQPYAWSAWVHLYRVGVGWSANVASDAAQSALLASRSLELDDSNARALAVYGHLSAFLHHDYDAALDMLDRAVKVCPNEPFCWALSSASMSYVGHSECAVANAEHALRLSPLDRFRFYYAAALGLAHYTAGRFDTAIKWGRISHHENPIFTPNLR